MTRQYSSDNEISEKSISPRSLIDRTSDKEESPICEVIHNTSMSPFCENTTRTSVKESPDRSRSPIKRNNSRHSDNASRSRSPVQLSIVPTSNTNKHNNNIENRRKTEPNSCIAIFGLSLETKEEDLTKIFEKYGKIEKINLITNKVRNKSRGYCFINYDNVASAITAVEATKEMEIDGNIIRVEYCFVKKSRDTNPRDSRQNNYRRNLMNRSKERQQNRRKYDVDQQEYCKNLDSRSRDPRPDQYRRNERKQSRDTHDNNKRNVEQERNEDYFSSKSYDSKKQVYKKHENYGQHEKVENRRQNVDDSLYLKKYDSRSEKYERREFDRSRVRQVDQENNYDDRRYRQRSRSQRPQGQHNNARRNHFSPSYIPRSPVISNQHLRGNITEHTRNRRYYRSQSNE